MLKALTIFCYLAIILSGDHISLPFGVGLVAALFDIQAFTFIAVIGWGGIVLFASGYKYFNSRALRSLINISLMIAPIIYALAAMEPYLVGNQFNSVFFMLPLILFLVLYSVQVLLPEN